MAEKLIHRQDEYTLIQRLFDGSETWELWHGFRDLCLLRYGNGSEIFDFEANDGGALNVAGTWLEVYVPKELRLGQRSLDEKEIQDFAARMHIALCAMTPRNAVVWERSWPALPEADRKTILRDFQTFMEQRGWRVTINPEVEQLLIKRRGFPVLRVKRPKPTDAELVDQGARVAEAWHAMLDRDLDYTALFIGEGAGQATPSAKLEWR